MDAVQCVVYKSRRKPDTYLYLPQGDDFTRLPADLRAVFGEPEKVMELALSNTSRLAREKVEDVLRNLRDQGYHLQLPPGVTTLSP